MSKYGVHNISSTKAGASGFPGPTPGSKRKANSIDGDMTQTIPKKKKHSQWFQGFLDKCDVWNKETLAYATHPGGRDLSPGELAQWKKEHKNLSQKPLPCSPASLIIKTEPGVSPAAISSPRHAPPISPVYIPNSPRYVPSSTDPAAAGPANQHYQHGQPDEQDKGKEPQTNDYGQIRNEILITLSNAGVPMSDCTNPITALAMITAENMATLLKSVDGVQNNQWNHADWTETEFNRCLKAVDEVEQARQRFETDYVNSQKRASQKAIQAQLNNTQQEVRRELDSMYDTIAAQADLITTFKTSCDEELKRLANARKELSKNFDEFKVEREEMSHDLEQDVAVLQMDVHSLQETIHPCDDPSLLLDRVKNLEEVVDYVDKGLTVFKNHTGDTIFEDCELMEGRLSVVEESVRAMASNKPKAPSKGNTVEEQLSTMKQQLAEEFHDMVTEEVAQQVEQLKADICQQMKQEFRDQLKSQVDEALRAKIKTTLSIWT